MEAIFDTGRRLLSANNRTLFEELEGIDGSSARFLPFVDDSPISGQPRFRAACSRTIQTPDISTRAAQTSPT